VAQFKLNVTGVEGVYVASLFFGNEKVTEFESASVKAAQKRARAEAIEFELSVRTARLETYTETFTV